MADADSRLKRQSATCMVVPSMLSGVFADTAGVVQAERQAVTWMYSGITVAGAAVGTVPPFIFNPQMHGVGHV